MTPVNKSFFLHIQPSNIFQVLRLLQHLVKFGYYSDLDDVRHLLTPLLSQLDGRHDVPFPKDKSKGTMCYTSTIHLLI